MWELAKSGECFLGLCQPSSSSPLDTLEFPVVDETRTQKYLVSHQISDKIMFIRMCRMDMNTSDTSSGVLGGLHVGQHQPIAAKEKEEEDGEKKKLTTCQFSFLVHFVRIGASPRVADY